MDETIKSGETENVVNMLLTNSFGHHLMSIAHSRHSSLRNTLTSNYDFGGIGTFNLKDLPEELSPDIQIDQKFLEGLKNPNKFTLYTVTEDFQAIEDRQVSVKKELTFVGLQVLEDKWVFGCPDSKPNSFGFVPLNYL